MAEHTEERWNKSPGMFAALLSGPTFFLFAFLLAPLAIVWGYSFGHNEGLKDITVDGNWLNYAHALNPLYLSILAKSLFFAAVTTVLCLIIGFPVALAITFAKPTTKPWLLLLIMLPFWTNLLIRTYALMAVLRTQGYVNGLLGFLWNSLGHGLAAVHGPHLAAFQPLDLLYNNFAVILGLVYVQLPFMVLPLYSALDRLDRSLLEASLDLGAGHIRTMLMVVVPLAMPGIASGILVTLIPSLGAFLTPDLLGGVDSQMIANVIERQFKAANDWPFGSALSFLLMYMTFAAIAMQAMMTPKGGARS
jgi:spermidine/putrescine transport system permease protein